MSENANQFGEPWEKAVYGVILDCAGKPIMQDSHGPRAVACVNALAGVPYPEAAVKAAREAMMKMLDWIENDCPDAKGNQYGRLGIATGAMMLALAALGGGK